MKSPGSLSRPAFAPIRPKTRRRSRLRLEGLEDRVTPATFHVANVADFNTALTQANRNADGSNTILVAAGTFVMVDKNIISGGSDETSIKTLTIRGAGPGATVFTADNAGRVLNLFGQVNLESLTVTGGKLAPTFASNTVPFGGGMTAQGHHTMRNVVVEGNTAVAPDATGDPTMNAPDGDIGRPAAGGGIFVGSGSLDMFNCTVRNNSVTGGNGGDGLEGSVPGFGGEGGWAKGGGIYKDGGTLTMTDCTVSNNTVVAGRGGDGGKYLGLPTDKVPHAAYRSGGVGGAASGGGLAAQDGCRVVAVRTTIADNSVRGGDSSLGGDAGAGQGGGFFLLANCTGSFFDTTVSGNSATGGDGHGSRVLPRYDTGVLVGEYFLTNQAGDGQGGGGFVNSGTLSIVQGTFTNNTAGGGAGGDATGQFLKNEGDGYWGQDGGRGGTAAGGALCQLGGTVAIFGGTYSSSRALGGPGGAGSDGGNDPDMMQYGGWGGLAGHGGPAFGAGIYVGGGALTGFGATISDNSAGGGAGAQGGNAGDGQFGGYGGLGEPGGSALGGGVHVGHGGGATLVDSTVESNVAAGGLGGNGGVKGSGGGTYAVDGKSGSGGDALGAGLYGFGKVYLYNDTLSGTVTGGTGGATDGDGGDARGAGLYLAPDDINTGQSLVDAIIRGINTSGTVQAGGAGGPSGIGGDPGTDYDNDSSLIPGTVAPAATRFATSAVPPGLQPGVPFPFPLYVVATDDAGNVAADYSAPDPDGVAGRLSLALKDNPGVATLTGTLKAQAVNGLAVFDGLTLDRPGTGYTLAATGAAGLTAGVTATFDVAGLNATVKGTVFADANHNGAWNKPAETPLAGATVELVLPDGSTRRATTDAAGKYQFTGVPAGAARVHLVLADDQLQTTPADPHGLACTLSKPNQVVTLPDLGRADGIATRVTVQSVTSTLPGVSVPGEACKVTVVVKNETGATVNAGGGDALVTVYATAGGQRYPIGTQAVAAGKVFGLAPKQVAPVVVACKFPALGDPGAVPEGDFRYEAVLGPAWKGASGTAASDSQHLYQFGTVGAGALTRKGVQITVRQVDPAFVEARYALAGPGTGFVADAAGVVNLSFQGTTTASQASAVRTAGSGNPSIRDMTATDLGALSMPDVDATGQLSFATLDTLSVHQLGGDPGSVLTIGGGSAAQAVAGRKVTTLPDGSKDIRAAVIEGNIDAKFGVARIVAGKWLDNDDDMDLVTPFVRFLTVGGEMQADLDITGPPARGQALVQATIGGAVKNSLWRLRDPGGAGRIQVGSADEWQLLADGPVTLLQVKGDYRQRRNGPDPLFPEPSIRASSFGTLELLGNTDARGIEVTGQADQVAIGKLNVRQVYNLDTLTAPAGGIRSLESAGWGADTAITTLWVGTLTVKSDPKVALSGDFKANLHLTGTGTDGKTSLQSATVENALHGTWDVFGNVGPVKAGSIVWTFTGRVVDGTPVTDVGSLDATRLLGGTTKAHVIGPVRAGQFYLATIEADRLTSLTATKDPKAADSGTAEQLVLHVTGPGSHTTLTVAGDIQDSTITVAKEDSGFDSITARSWQSGSVQGGYIGTLKLTGDLQSGSVSGNPQFNLTGHSPAGHSLDRLDVTGDVSAATFTFGRGAGTISAGGFQNSTFTADGHRIDRFEVRPQQKGGPIPLYEATAVKAATIGQAVLRGVVTSTTSSVTAQLIERYVRFAGGVIAAQGQSITKAKVDAGEFKDQEGGFRVVLEPLT